MFYHETRLWPATLGHRVVSSKAASAFATIHKFYLVGVDESLVIWPPLLGIPSTKRPSAIDNKVNRGALRRISAPCAKEFKNSNIVDASHLRECKNILTDLFLMNLAHTSHQLSALDDRLGNYGAHQTNRHSARHEFIGPRQLAT
jgi:hypothetical protein